MAEHGAKVLVLERETQFKDRVRGEGTMPWGVADARRSISLTCCKTLVDEHYRVIHKVEDWWREIFYAGGPQADARRAQALPLVAQDLTRVPDHIFSGPDLPADETVRRRFFGEE